MPANIQTLTVEQIIALINSVFSSTALSALNQVSFISACQNSSELTNLLENLKNQIANRTDAKITLGTYTSTKDGQITV